MALSITDLKKGKVFQLDGTPYKVLDYGQKVMGRGGSIVNVRIKSLLDGRVLDKTFKGNEQLDSANVTAKSLQYLYGDGVVLHFMSEQTYEQFELPLADCADQAGYMKEGERVQAQFFNDQIINIELPKNVWLEVTHAEVAVRGDTSTAITKEAQTETGLKLKVPAFIKQGDIISVDTITGAYRGRQRD